VLRASGQFELSGMLNFFYDEKEWHLKMIEIDIRDSLVLQREVGWSVEALRAGAADCGLSPAAAGVLQRREAELVEASGFRCRTVRSAASPPVYVR
jgi:hypothetical protein